MRIRFTLDIERAHKDKPERPEGDNFATVETAEYTKDRQIGFTRPDDYDEESGDKSRRRVRPAR